MALEAHRQLSARNLTDQRAALLNRKRDGDGVVDSAMHSVIDGEGIADLLPEGTQECW